MIYAAGVVLLMAIRAYTPPPVAPPPHWCAFSDFEHGYVWAPCPDQATLAQCQYGNLYWIDPGACFMDIERTDDGNKRQNHE